MTAPSSGEMRRAFRVTGTVLSDEFQTRLPQLLVTLYDATSNDKSQDTPDRESKTERGFNRLGSVLTNSQGKFDIFYYPEGYVERMHHRIDILLTVSPAEDSCLADEEQKRVIARCQRRNAARIESFLISIGKEKLKSNGISLPEQIDPVEAMIAKRNASRKYRARLQEESNKFVADRLQKIQETKKTVDSKFSKFLSAISAVPHDDKALLKSKYVPQGTSVSVANKQLIRQNIETRVNVATITRGVMLTESQAEVLKDETGNFASNIPPSQIESFIHPPNSRGSSLVASRRPPCLERQKDPCMADLDENDPNDEDHDGKDSQAVLNIGARTNDLSAISIPELSVAISDSSKIIFDGYTPISQKVEKGIPLTIIARDNGQYQFARWEDSSIDRTRTVTLGSGTTQLLAFYNVMSESIITNSVGNMLMNMTSPDSTTIFQIQNRAGAEDIQDGISTFMLHSGPADIPAFFDFHNLKIAFENVWQELFDDGLLKQGKELYSKLVELGLDPNEYLLSSGEFDTESFKNGVISSAAAIDQIIDASEYEAVNTSDSIVPSTVVTEFGITQEQWNNLSPTQQEALQIIADNLKAKEEELEGWLTSLLDSEDVAVVEIRSKIKELRAQGMAIFLQQPAPKMEDPAEKFARYHEILQELGKTLKEAYRFSIYAANGKERSINFGVIATYRQKWEPLNYQVGQLVKTIPLAPKEVRRFSKKVTIKKSRSEKEVENNLQARKIESTETTRTEKEIIQKAQNKTNFKLAAEGGVDIEIANAKASSEFMKESSAESQEVKKEFREAVFKAAEEYKSERTVEINVSTGEETSLEESGEISNPNDEIPVTYLFYELQRRFRLSENLHQVMPVILVAQEFPKPSDIDEDWIISNDWILRRVILDDSFLPALNYVTSKVVGDEFSLQEMYQNIVQQRFVIQNIQGEIVEVKSQLVDRYSALQASIESRAKAIEAKEDDGGLLGWTIETTFGGGSSASPEAMQAREDAARDAYERAAKQEKDLEEKLGREVTALNALSETYAKNLSDHLNRRAQISRLKVHIKSNIIYYMQAIWSHEPPDQRFFRLHEVPVPKLTGKMTYKLENDPDAIPMPPTWIKPLKLIVKCQLDQDFEYKTLEEMADLDNLLGFKGNFMMFPLRESNVLTDYMMTPYFDPTTIIRDPDTLAQWTLPEFSEYVCCLSRTTPRKQFEKFIPGLKEVYNHLINGTDPNGDEVVVPTGSLFIEALPGAHPILEDFKLMHRLIDVKKAKADVRAAELENIRAAARILSDELEDPNIEKKVVIEGGSSVIVSPDDHP